MPGDGAWTSYERSPRRKSTVFCPIREPLPLDPKAYGAHYLMASVVVAYEETDDTQDLVAQVIYGGRGANGQLPITASSFYKAGDGHELLANGRFGYTFPEGVGMQSLDLATVDDIVRTGIDAKAYPGCQVLVAVDGQVVMNKAYGHTTYARSATRPHRRSL
jgi:hypothetical protein